MIWMNSDKLLEILERTMSSNTNKSLQRQTVIIDKPLHGLKEYHVDRLKLVFRKGIRCRNAAAPA